MRVHFARQLLFGAAVSEQREEPQEELSDRRPLLVPQGHCRIDGGGVPGRQVTRGHRHHRKAAATAAKVVGSAAVTPNNIDSR